MSEWTYEPSATRDGVTIPRFWIAVAISLLLHAAVLWKWIPDWRLPSAESLERGDPSGSLVVELAPPARPAPSVPSPAIAVPPAPRRTAPPPPPPAPSPRAQPAPPVIALNKPSPSAPALPSAVPPTVAPAPSTPAGDLASYIESRRRARAEAAPSQAQAPAPPAEDENARANRVAAANLASQRRMTFGHDPTKGGGIFTIQRLTHDNAEFIFFGWNKEIERNTSQLIEVRRGNAADIRTAVVRRMIAIIREQEQGDFMWESKRLERTVTLSARQKDTAGLEEFMMSEFFEDARRPQYIRRD